ncbi:MAG: hypothetical protein GAK43_01924 [Stenotrophomonas maltophilia]|nr:MAG: hypothetical protein GAK43_01924 [Stenotrophomonas maltophilia]
MDSLHVTLTVVIIGMGLLGTGFTLRERPLGLLLMWIGVLTMLSIISYRIYLATSM